MSDYIAPVEHMKFVLMDVIGIEKLPQFQSGELDSDTVEAVLEEAGKLASGVLAPLNEIGDREGNVFENGKVKTATGFKDAAEPAS